MSHDGFTFGAYGNHSLSFVAESDQASVGLGALLAQSRPGLFQPPPFRPSALPAVCEPP
jgi:hypothetical protein